MDKIKYVFPSDLEGGDKYSKGKGIKNLSFPFSKITFYKWASQSNLNNIQSSAVANFILQSPDNGLVETFNHSWSESLDPHNLLASGKKGMFKAAAGVFLNQFKISDSAAGSLMGQGINDMMAQSYNNLDFRRFDITYTLTCKNETDSKELFDIINRIKVLTTPIYGTNLTYAYPHICDLTFYSNSSQQLFKTDLCGVETFQVNYAPDVKIRQLQNGQPLQIQMTIGLRELRRKIITPNESGNNTGNI